MNSAFSVYQPRTERANSTGIPHSMHALHGAHISHERIAESGK